MEDTEDIENVSLRLEKELDFNDVLILPQPNSLSSRSNVNLERRIKFVNENGNNPKYWTGIPIISSN